MYNIKDYENREDCKILFQQANLFVVEQEAPEPIGTFWLVSDGISMFTSGTLPELTASSIQEALIEYEQEKQAFLLKLIY
jgi:hypothetical protein